MKRALGLLLLLLIIAAVVVKIVVFEIPAVAGNDMAPALQAGDRLLVYRLDTAPARGALVLIEHPESERLLLRRVVGLPGDRVAVTREVPRVNGTPATRKLAGETVLQDGGQEIRLRLIEEELLGARYPVLKDPARRSVDLPERSLDESYFVLADNRNHGTDSRTFGPVPRSKIRGVITHRIAAGPGTLKDQQPRPGWLRLR